MTNNLLAASKGTVDAVCFTPAFSNAETYYKISHDVWYPKASSIDFGKAVNANIFYFGLFGAIAEYHTAVADKPIFNGHIQMALWVLLPPSHHPFS